MKIALMRISLDKSVYTTMWFKDQLAHTVTNAFFQIPVDTKRHTEFEIIEIIHIYSCVQIKFLTYSIVVRLL